MFIAPNPVNPYFYAVNNVPDVDRVVWRFVRAGWFGTRNEIRVHCSKPARYPKTRLETRGVKSSVYILTRTAFSLNHRGISDACFGLSHDPFSLVIFSDNASWIYFLLLLLLNRFSVGFRFILYVTGNIRGSATDVIIYNTVLLSRGSARTPSNMVHRFFPLVFFM